MKKPRSNNLNPRAGADFENRVKNFLETRYKAEFEKHAVFPIGVGKLKKPHKFDLVSRKRKLIVECKSYTWTVGGNFPSAKIGFLNEVMFYFSLAPKGYRKILFMRNHKNKHGVSLAHRYVKTNSHLIPKGVEIWEMLGAKAQRVY